MRRFPHSTAARLAVLLASFVCAVYGAPVEGQSTGSQVLKAAPAAKRPVTRRPTWTAPVGVTQLGDALSSVIDNTSRFGRWGVLVVSLSRGDTLYGRNADSPLLPASTMKVFTSAMALDYLGPDHQFETRVLREGQLDSSGTLAGDLVLRGAGDPSFALTAGWDPMRYLARDVWLSGVRTINGSIVGDASAFEKQRIPDGWLQRYLGASYAARVSALSYNGNIVRVVVRVVSGKPSIAFSPAVSGLRISNSVKVRSGSRSGSIAVRQDSSGGFVVSGWIGSSSPPRGYQCMIENPEMFAAGALHAALIAEGVRINGGVAARPAGSEATRVASLASQPLASLVARMNGESNNHFAELLFRNVAASTGAIGSADTGNRILRSFVADKVRASTTDLFAADGSGLSTLDRITPRSLVSVLDYSARAAWAPVFESSLPIAGETGTLRGRTRGAPAQGRLRAKTGSTNEVRSLGGYVTTQDGEELAFAFIYNGTDINRAKMAIDAMGSTLASFAR